MTGTVSHPASGHIRWEGTVGAAVGLAVVGAVLSRMGAGSLSVPLGSVRELTSWLEATPPPVVAMALVRLVALVAWAYLLVALVVAVVAGLAPQRRLAVLLGQLAPDALRRVVTCGARSGLVTSVALGWLGPLAGGAVAGAGPGTPGPPAPLGMAGPEAEPPPATATMTQLDSGDARPRDTDLGRRGDPGQDDLVPGGVGGVGGVGDLGDPGDDDPAVPQASATLAHLGPAPSPTTVPTPAAPAGDPQDARPSDETWVVSPGDSFWSIAEEALADARGGSRPDDAEISRYWQSLIAANRDRLTAPDNPDLLTVGQVLLLPPWP